jgi:hypothetical protein
MHRAGDLVDVLPARPLRPDRAELDLALVDRVMGRGDHGDIVPRLSSKMDPRFREDERLETVIPAQAGIQPLQQMQKA